MINIIPLVSRLEEKLKKKKIIKMQSLKIVRIVKKDITTINRFNGNE